MLNKKPTMTDIQSYKPLSQAIIDGETRLRITSPSFLVASAVAERCEFDEANIQPFLDLVWAAKNGQRPRNNPDYTYTLVGNRGKHYWITLSLSILAMTIRIIQILHSLHATMTIEHDEAGALTGMATIDVSV